MATVGVVVALLGLLVWGWIPAESGGPSPQEEPTTQLESPPSVAFAITGTVEDRLTAEPCNRIQGGALSSLPAFHDETRDFVTTFGISMGNLTLVPGEIGRRSAGFLYPDGLAAAGPRVVCAGEGELGLGVDFARGFLSELRTGDSAFHVLCANAVDPAGRPVLRGWTLADVAGRMTLLVAVAADSLGEELVRRGSDVSLVPASQAVGDARQEALDQAQSIERVVHTEILLVHGTVKETEAILRENPGFTFAVAGRGGILANREPVLVGSTPVLYPGRGLRFGWRVLIDDAATPAITPAVSRIGTRLLMLGSPIHGPLRYFLQELSGPLLESQSSPDQRLPGPEGDYVGGQACASCHEEQAAQHATSRHSRRPKDMPAAGSCTSCHTTGTWYRTGWRGEGDDRDLGSVSCESCHGPGGAHVAEPDEPYGRTTLASCYACHLPERSPGFDAEAMWRELGHAGPSVPPTKDGDEKDGDDEKVPPPK